MTTPQAARLDWRRSSRCEANGCVEVAMSDGGVLVRNSTDPDGAVLPFSRQAWSNFVADIPPVPVHD